MRCLKFLLIRNKYIVQWSCSIASFAGEYGTDCGFFSTVASAKSTLRLPHGKMSAGTKYAFLLTVTSLDGRSATNVVTVTPAFAGSPEVFVTSAVSKFNTGSKLVLGGHVSSSASVTSVWSVYTSLGELVPFEALTPTTKSFSPADVSSPFIFPLSVDTSTFIGGRSYTFRLTAYSTQFAGKSTFSELVLTVNAPPTGGHATVSPSTGEALVTKFYISSPGWTTDVENYPLSYSFAYKATITAPYLTLAASDTKAFTISTLPAGPSMFNNSVTIKSDVADVFLTSVSSITTVAVFFNPDVNVSEILSSTLTNAFSSSDINLVFQTVNNVSHSAILLLVFRAVTQLLNDS